MEKGGTIVMGCRWFTTYIQSKHMFNQQESLRGLVQKRVQTNHRNGSRYLQILKVCTTRTWIRWFSWRKQHLQEGILGHHKVFNILILELGANIWELLPHFPLKEEANFEKFGVLHFFPYFKTSPVSVLFCKILSYFDPKKVGNFVFFLCNF